MVANPLVTPKGTLSQRIRMIPALDTRFRAELARVSSAPIWDKKALLDRVAKVAAIFAIAPSSPKVDAHVRTFQNNRPQIERFINAGGLTNYVPPDAGAR